MSKREVIVKNKATDKSKKVSRVRLFIGPSEKYDTGVRYTALKDMEHIDSPNFQKMLEQIAQGGNSGIERDG